MIAVHSSAVTALHRQDEARKAREDRMRNALEILAHDTGQEPRGLTAFSRFVRATAREGLGRDEPTNQEG